MMETIKDTDLELGTRIWSLDPPTPTLFVVVKATFDLTAGPVALLAPEQEPCLKDVPQDEVPDGTLRHASDFALLKPLAEVLLRGSCHAPKGEAVPQLIANFQVGDVGRSLAIFGDRFWKWGVLGRASTAPVPFTSMPLRWARAFGGPAVRDNPVGRGIAKESSGFVFLPNIEDPNELIASPWQKPKPVGAFPLPSGWQSRLELFGTSDQQWRETRHPFFPKDFDSTYYNVAPPELRNATPFRGDELITMKNLVRDHLLVSSRLPGTRARAFVEWDKERGGALEEVPLALDTVTLDTDEGQALCLWRGQVELPGEVLEPTGVARLFVMDEHIVAQTPIEGCRERMSLKLVEEQAFEDLAGFDDEDAASTMLGDEPTPLIDPIGFQIPEIKSDAFDDMPSTMIRPWTRETLEAVDLSVGAERGEVAKPGDLRGPPKLGATVQSSDSEWEVAPTQIFDETVEMSPMTAETIASAANEYPEPEDPFASDQSEAVRYYVKMMRKMRGLS